MNHPFTKSGNLISYLILIALISYGLNYQITKTLLHISAFIGVIIWARIVVENFADNFKFRNNLSMKDPRVILSLLLIISATIVLIETSLSDAPMSARFKKDFVIPAICFATILPVACVSTQTFNIFRWAVPVAILTMSIPGVIDQYAQGSVYYRTSGNISLQIIYGTNLAVLCSAAILLIMTTKPLKHPILIASNILAIALGVWAISLSGSRGPLLSILVVSFTATTLLGFRYVGLLKTIIILSLISVSVVFAAFHSSTYSRLTQGLNNISSDVRDSSMGLRFEMWRGAGDIISEHPLHGIGVGKQDNYFKEKIAEDNDYMHPKAVGFIHLHNDLINAMTWMGIPLGILFMAFVIYPLVWALRHRSDNMAQATMAVSTIYILNGLTNTPSIRATSLILMLSVIFLLLQFAHSNQNQSSPLSSDR